VEPPGEGSEPDTDQPADRCLADQLGRFQAGVPTGRGEDEEEEDEGQREAVVQARLQVQRVADRGGHQSRGDDS
jgi:hypothetical protein